MTSDKMIVKVKELPENGESFSGRFEASFIDKDNGKTYKLRYRLSENDRDPNSYFFNGFFGGNYYQLLYPERMQLEFNKDYEIEKSVARKIWEMMTTHGWVPAEDYFKVYK